jgi:aminoglycoside phosphotransferase
MRARLAAAGFPVRRARHLSRAGEAPVFRLELEDGRVVKARVFRTEKSARRVWRLATEAAPSVLSRPLQRVGRAIVSEYLDGETLDARFRRAGRRFEEGVVRSMGRLVAALHVEAGFRPIAPSTAVTPAAFQRALARVARRLANRELLTAGSAARVIRFVRPATVRYTLTHGDVCPENVVMTARGPRLIDEERLAVRPVDFELARVVTRWPLTPRLEQVFLAAYRRAGGRDQSFRAHRSFWVAVALAGSAAYRLRRGLPGVRRAASALDALGGTKP